MFEVGKKYLRIDHKFTYKIIGVSEHNPNYFFAEAIGHNYQSPYLYTIHKDEFRHFTEVKPKHKRWIVLFKVGKDKYSSAACDYPVTKDHFIDGNEAIAIKEVEIEEGEGL